MLTPVSPNAYLPPDECWIQEHNAELGEPYPDGSFEPSYSEAEEVIFMVAGGDDRPILPVNRYTVCRRVRVPSGYKYLLKLVSAAIPEA